MILDNSRKAFEYLRKKMRTDIEEVWVIALNSQLHIIADDLLFRGHLNKCLVHPREIFRFVISKNSAFFLLAHSHPSGQTTPSTEDKTTTQKLVSLSLLHEIPLLDHLIITDLNFLSMSDAGLIEKFKTRAVTGLRDHLL